MPLKVLIAKGFRLVQQALIINKILKSKVIKTRISFMTNSYDLVASCSFSAVKNQENLGADQQESKRILKGVRANKAQKTAVEIKN